MQQQQREDLMRLMREHQNNIANLAALYIDDAYSLSELTCMFADSMKVIKALNYSLTLLDETAK